MNEKIKKSSEREVDMRRFKLGLVIFVCFILILIGVLFDDSLKVFSPWNPVAPPGVPDLATWSPVAPPGVPDLATWSPVAPPGVPELA